MTVSLHGTVQECRMLQEKAPEELSLEAAAEDRQ